MALLAKSLIEQGIAVSTGESSHIIVGVVDGMNVFSLVVVMAVGFGAGLCCGCPVLVLGLATVAGLPILSIVDGLLNGGHNLIPFEIFFQALLAFPAAFGAGLGRIVRQGLGPWG